MKTWQVAALAAVLALPVQAGEIVRIKAAGSVAAVTDALEAAVVSAGAKVAARIDHAGAAAKAGMDLAPEQLLIFGNPKLGTPAMQDDPLSGLYLPLKVLVFEDAGGQVWLAYEDPGEMLGGLAGVPADAGYLAKMRGALAKLTEKAAAAQ